MSEPWAEATPPGFLHDSSTTPTMGEEEAGVGKGVNTCRRPTRHRQFTHSPDNFCPEEAFKQQDPSHPTLSWIKSLKAGTEVYFLDPEKSMIKMVPTPTLLPCILGFSFCLGILFITETCLWTQCWCLEENFSIVLRKACPGRGRVNLGVGAWCHPRGSEQCLWAPWHSGSTFWAWEAGLLSDFLAQFFSASLDLNLCVPPFGLVTWTWFSIACGGLQGQQLGFGIATVGNGIQDRLISLIILLALSGSPVFLGLMGHAG